VESLRALETDGRRKFFRHAAPAINRRSTSVYLIRMARPILGPPVSHEKQQRTESARQTHARLAGPQLTMRLREKRSAKYVAAMQRLDAGTHQQNAATLRELLDAIAEEFPELSIDQRPFGIVSKCFLGEPFEVHRCDIDGNIVEHFQRHRAMPPLFERARGLAAHGAYQFIEIYADSLRAIAADGSVAML
jgi:hypothetical protein